MKRIALGVVFVVAASCLVFASVAEAVPQNKDQQKCITKINKSAWKVSDKQGKENSKCVKFAGKGKLDKLGATDADDCLTADTKGKVQKKKDKTLESETKFCTGDGVPDFGVPAGSALATVANAAAMDEPIGLMTDIFGASLDAAVIDCDSDKDGCKCQDKVAKNALKLFSTKVKEFIKCKKFALKEGKSPFTSGAASAADLEACVDDAGTAGSIAADSKGKILRKADKLAKDIFKKCEEAKSGPVAVSSAFPGNCAGADPSGGETLAANEFAQCIDERVECRVCLMLNDIDDLDVDCDLFDDGLANSSCPPAPLLGSHKCTFDNSGPAPGPSTVTVITQALPLAPFTAEGAIDVSCGAVDAGTGKAPCTCDVQTFEPIEITAIGFVCFLPGDPCPTGEIDCDGGNGLDVTMDSDHNIGTCTGNADCASQCDAHCSGMSMDYFASGCEGYCLGGSNDGNPCDADSDCPDGSCPGRDEPNQHDDICQCDCAATGGAPSAAGDLQCNLSVSINVESNAPCGDGDVAIAVGTRCIPLTSAAVSSQIHNTNNTAAKDFPNPAFTASGTGIDCNDLATSVTTGLNLVGSVNFFDSTIGDINSQVAFACQ